MKVVHVDQAYCAPGRLTSDNISLIWYVLDISGSMGMDTDLILKDQEKAFDWPNICTCGRHCLPLGLAQN